MTPSALPTNVAPVANTAPSAPSSDANNASNGTRSDFSKPLQQAHQQLARQNEPARPSHARHASSSQTGSSSPTSAGDGKQDDDQHDDQADVAGAQGATAAMLALLGQSVPASAAPTPVADGGDAAVTAATVPAVVSSNVTLLGAIAQAKPGNAQEISSPLEGVKDKSLSLLAQGGDDGDDTTDVSTDDTAPAAKASAFTDALQALTTSSSSSSSSDQKNNSDPLDALKNLAASTLQAPPQAQLNAAVTTPHNLAMQSSVGSPAFGQELSQQVTWLGGQDVKEARIRLHPEDMGELDVKVSVKQDHVDVAFIAQHPQAVHAVQQTLTQLDSMLAHHGLSLGQAMVGQGNSGQGSAQSGASGGSSSGGEGGLGEVVGDVAAVAAPVVKAVGLVDMFA